MNLVFDFDGTICDGTNTVVEILNIKLKEIGYPKTSKSELRNSGLKGILSSRKVSMDKLKGTPFSGKKLFNKRIPHLKTFLGLPEVLSQLAQKHNLSIVTSNAKYNVDDFLKHNHLGQIFSSIIGDSEIFGKEEAIKEAQADYYIGDETRDIEAARKAGVKAVSVTWGFESKTSLQKSSPDFLITRPSQLLTLL